jgi:hypothetical protein
LRGSGTGGGGKGREGAARRSSSTMPDMASSMVSYWVSSLGGKGDDLVGRRLLMGLRAGAVGSALSAFLASGEGARHIGRPMVQRERSGEWSWGCDGRKEGRSGDGVDAVTPGDGVWEEEEEAGVKRDYAPALNK